MKYKCSANSIYAFTNKGQAIVETILIMVVSVTLVFTLALRIFKPMQTFVQELMGTYVSCLLETGELPSLSGPNAQSVCVKPQFITNNANPQLSSSGSQGQSGGSSDPSSEDGEKNSKNRNSDLQSQSGGRGASSSRRLNTSSPESRTSSADGAAVSSKTSNISSTGVATGGAFFRGNTNSYSSFSTPINRRRSFVIPGITEAQREELEKKSSQGTRVIASGDSLAPPQKKTLVKPPPPKAPEEQEGESAFSVGNIFRIIMIAAIIIILITLIGGQALSLAKSWEK